MPIMLINNVTMLHGSPKEYFLRLGEFCYCRCSPLLPQLALSIPNSTNMYKGRVRVKKPKIFAYVLSGASGMAYFD